MFKCNHHLEPDNSIKFLLWVFCLEMKLEYQGTNEFNFRHTQNNRIQRSSRDRRRKHRQLENLVQQNERNENLNNQITTSSDFDAQELMLKLMQQDLVNHELLEQSMMQKRIIEQQSVFLAEFVEEFVKQFSQRFIQEICSQTGNFKNWWFFTNFFELKLSVYL